MSVLDLVRQLRIFRAFAMMRNFVRRMRCWTLILLGWAFTFSAGDTPARETQWRDWHDESAIVQLDTTEGAFALRDTHGNFKRLVRLLLGGRRSESVPDTRNQAGWSASKSLRGYTRDLLRDKSHHGLEVVELLIAL